jgi:ketosteroid isomerase-like protein
MSRENVEIARRTYEGFARGDWDTFIEFMDPDVRFESLILEVEGGAYRGLDGVREFFDLTHEVFGETWRVEITGIEELGERFLVIESRSSGAGRAGGVPVPQAFWQAAEMRDRKIVWWKFCRTRAEALEAVGLSE